MTRFMTLFGLNMLLIGNMAESFAVDHPCRAIKQACEAAGFFLGGAKNQEGLGLWKDCIDPLIQGTTSKTAKKPLPNVDPTTLAACRAKKASFGHGKIGD